MLWNYNVILTVFITLHLLKIFEKEIRAKWSSKKRLSINPPPQCETCSAGFLSFSS